MTKKTMTSFSERLEILWLQRWNQNVDGALHGLALLQAERGWEELESSMLSQVPKNAVSDLSEALLLKASCLRAQGKHKISSQLIGKIYKHYQTQDSEMSFHLAFEVGLDCWMSEDHQRALEFFIMAEVQATSDVQHLFCYSNMLWSLESLDLEREDIERQLEIKLQNPLMNRSLASVKHVSDQYQAYILRKKFYQGSLRVSDLEANLNETQRITQSVFFAALINRLPYFTGSRETGGTENIELFRQNYLWQGSYRLRTLEGVLLPGDRDLTRSGDAIDRLYLWTWMLLTENSAMSLEKIEVTLASLLPQIELEKLSVENRLLLRNSLKWLSILSPRSAAPFKSLMQSKSEPSPRYKILEDEALLIDAIVARKNNLPSQKLGYHWPRIADEIKNCQASLQIDSNLLLSRIAKYLVENRRLERTEDRSLEWIVDMNSFEIRSVRSGDAVRSKSLAEMLQGLFKEGKIPLRRLGLEFEEDRRKAYNLVSRARCFLPEAGIHIQDDAVVCEQAHELKIYFAREDLQVTSELVTDRVTARRAGTPEKIVSREAARVQFREGFSRQELEKSFRVSKAKACRVIADWADAGLIEKMGNGKSQSYKWRSV